MIPYSKLHLEKSRPSGAGMLLCLKVIGKLVSSLASFFFLNLLIGVCCANIVLEAC